MQADAVDISVVIPVYNSSECLPELLRRLTGVLDQRPGRYEVILIDDASGDDSWAVIQEQVPKFPHVWAIQLMRNRGQAIATICGLAHARGKILVTMDDDLQHRPDQLPVLLDALETHPEADCVFGYFRDKKHPAFQNVCSRIIAWINSRAFGLPRNVRTSSFRAMRRRTAQAVLRHRTANPAIVALLYGSTHRTLSVPVEHAPRFAGQSTYTLSKQIRLALDSICNVSLLPLRAVSALGLVACAASMVLVAVVLVRYFRGDIGVPGWTTVVILLSFFSGTILLSLGVVGEYMVRILREVRRAPMYVERETIGRLPGAEDGRNMP